ERVLFVVQHVVVVHLEDERDLPRELGRARLEKAQRRRIGVTAGADGELEVVGRVVGGRVHREGARGPVLEALIDGEDDEAPRAGESTVVEEARQVGAGPGAVARVPAEDFLDSLLHGRRPFWLATFDNTTR